jgi:hypothetical protein
MAQTYPLDRVIRRASKGTAARPESQRLVIVDAEQKAAVPRPAHPWRDVHHYLVSNRTDPSHECRVEIPAVALADVDERLEVTVTLLVSCPAGNEARVAVALFDPADAPHTVLEQRVVRCLRELSRDDVRAFAHRFYADPAGVQQALAQALESCSGLRVRARLSLASERHPHAVRVEEARLSVRVRDWDEELELAVRADLEVDDEGRPAAVLSQARVPELHALVPREIQAFVRRHVSLAEFGRLATGPDRRALLAHLNDVLRPYGRQIGALVLQPGTRFPTPPELTALEQVDVACTVREYPNPVTIGSRVRIRVVNLVQYRAQGSPDLRTWLRDTLHRLVPEALFEARYTDLLVCFDVWEERIKGAVRATAEEIGCDISQFVTDPDLPQKVLVKPFVLRVEGAFGTRLAGVEAKLEVVVTARIPQVEDIAALLGREPDIPRAMEKAIDTTLAAHMHTLHPERFYMRFGLADPERHAEETHSVEGELVRLVEQRLTGGEFHADVLSTVVKIVETDLIRRFRELQEATPSIVVRVEPLETETVEFIAELRVVGVHRDGWSRLRVQTGGIEQITDKVRDRVDTVLHTLATHELLYMTEVQRVALETHVSRSVLEYAAGQFGVAVRLLNLRRRLTPDEDAALGHVLGGRKRDAEFNARLQEVSQEALLNEYAGLAKALARLTEHRTERYGAEGDEGEVARLDKEIAGIKTQMEATRAALSAQWRRPALGAAAAPHALSGGPDGNGSNLAVPKEVDAAMLESADAAEGEP